MKLLLNLEIKNIGTRKIINLNEKVTPYIALVNPGDTKDVLSLVLNPANLLLMDKLKTELDTDENSVQILRLISTKKESDADIKYTVVKNGGENTKFINVPKNIEIMYPYTTHEVIKGNQDYCYLFPYSKAI